MNLDDVEAFKHLDPQDMYAEIRELPSQLQAAWELAHKQPLPQFPQLQQVVITGMGGSAIGADLLANFVSAHCALPIVIHRDYDLPAWAQGDKTLVVASSHSGNTEETLSSFQAARERGCSIVVICTGGKLATLGEEASLPVWHFEHKGQPRAAVGFSFGLLLGLFARLGLIPDPAAELESAIEAMRSQQIRLEPGIPTVQNLAKRMAGQFFGRWVVIFGSGVLAPVARRWKGQINELAKAWAQFDYLPEADHNTIAGLLNPSQELEHGMFVFLRSASDHPRNRLRSDVTRRIFMEEGLNTDTMDARGETTLAQMWTLLHLGDYIAYYLAMAYGMNPTPIEAIQSLKAELK